MADPVTTPTPEPKDWTRHVDPRDRARRELRQLERKYPVLFQGRPPAGHFY